jgi:hypothetical protein
MNQVLVCLKKNNGIIRLDTLDSWRKELVELGNAIRVGDLVSIPRHVRKALDAGASSDDIKKVAEFILGDRQLLSSILILQRSLDLEESDRHDFISIVDDCREE